MKSSIFKVLTLFFTIGMLMCCSSSSDDKGMQTDDDGAGGQIDSTVTVDTSQTIDQTVFTVIGDVPYNEEQKEGLVTLIDKHNANSKSEFVVHVGDIKPGADTCDEAVFEEVNGLLRKFETPTFIVLGDNEFNDCNNPEDALALWNTYFLGFNKNWDFPHTVDYQAERPENFAWVENGVLFLGLNIVGSSVHDQTEWNERLADDANWVEQHFELQKDRVEAAVLFAHANMTEVGPEKFEGFTDRFRAAARLLDKPILYMQGDGHFWFQNRPWPEQNILRVQIEGGANAVQVTVDPNLENPFQFDREFLD
ncbi:MAG: metallophosphoesterase [Pricia sp.]